MLRLRVRLIESRTTLREGQGNPIWVFKICNLQPGLQSSGCSKSWTQGWDCSLIVKIEYFSHSRLQICKIYIKHTRSNFSRLFGIDVVRRHWWFITGMGLSHPPGWDNISPDVQFGEYSRLKREKTFPQMCKFWV